MKRFAVLIAAMAVLPMLGGCGMVGNSENRVTTNYDQDGKVVSVVREGSDQDSWYGAISDAERQKTARVRLVMGDNEQHPSTTHPAGTSGDCSYALTEMGRAMRSMSVAFMEREHAVIPEPRGLWRSIDNTVDKVGLPLSIAIPMERMAAKMAKEGGDVTVSDDGTYNRTENALTASDGNGIGTTTNSPPTTTTTGVME